LYAAGDIALFPSSPTGERQRIEHWWTALQQGRIAAHNMVGAFKLLIDFRTEKPVRIVFSSKCRTLYSKLQFVLFLIISIECIQVIFTGI
jgi:NADPH-dependent 2,4-dienoyl-CoA reductase/sulfur reductase-like enzyme